MAMPVQLLADVSEAVKQAQTMMLDQLMQAKTTELKHGEQGHTTKDQPDQWYTLEANVMNQRTDSHREPSIKSKLLVSLTNIPYS